MSAFRNFGISFVIAILIFALAASYAIDFAENVFADKIDGTLLPGGPGSDIYNPEIDNNSQVKPIQSGRSFNMVIIGTDYDPELHHDYEAPSGHSGLFIGRKIKATAILFARFDKENRAFRLATVPPETVVTVDYVKMPLSEAFHHKGATFVKDAVATLTGCTVDYFISFSGKEFAEYTKTRLLTNDYTVPFTVFTNSENGLPAKTFIKGSKVTDPLSLYTLLHFTDYSFEKINERYLLIQSIFLQTLRKMSVTKNPDTYFNLFVSGLHTDMDLKAVEEQIEVLTTLPLYLDATENKTEVTVIDFYKYGGYSDEGLFYPNEESLRQVFHEYKTK